MKVDFHCHTTASDGALTPKALIDLAVEQGVTSMAITDHDTTAGYELVKTYAKEQGVQLYTGVEASCSWNGHTIHIVGLDFDVENPKLQQGLNAICDARIQRAEAMIEKLEAVKSLQIEDLGTKLWQLVNGGVVGRGHFAQLLKEEGVVKNGQQAFDKYLKKGKQGYAPCEWPALEKVVSLINEAGGIAIIAHPGIYKFTSRKLNRLIADFKAAGGRAIEVVNQPRHGAEIIGMAERANNHELYASMGSDFHRPEHTWRGLGWLAPMPQNVRPVWDLFKEPLTQKSSLT